METAVSSVRSPAETGGDCRFHIECFASVCTVFHGIFRRTLIMTSQNMLIAADGHLHWYPYYDVRAALSAIIANLDRMTEKARSDGTQVLNIGFLMERAGYSFFDQIDRGEIDFKTDGLEMVRSGDEMSVMFMQDDVCRLCLVSGLQIATSERLEILGIGTREAISDGLPAREAIRRVAKCGGIPILPWGAGKWLFNRGIMVRKLISAFRATELIIGDSSLRPQIWPEPEQMKLARQKGIAILPGSDPLPMPGEETIMGSYGFIYEGPFDMDHPAESVKTMLSSERARIQPAGGRNSLLQSARRILRMNISKAPKIS